MLKFMLPQFLILKITESQVNGIVTQRTISSVLRTVF